jgi:SAM-dependent methyltransferase
MSAPMLALARQRFRDDPRVEVIEADMRNPVPCSDPFDVVVSGFAIHHLDDSRKRSLLAEIAALLTPGGVFANLEVVTSATPRRHAEFLRASAGRPTIPRTSSLPSRTSSTGCVRQA